MIEVELEIKGDITRLVLGPDDKVVVNVPDRLSMMQVGALKTTVRAVFPDNEVLVCSDGIELSVVGPHCSLQ